MDFNLLHRIYHFPGVDIPADQGEGTCAKLADLFVQFSKLMVSLISATIHNAVLIGRSKALTYLRIAHFCSL